MALTHFRNTATQQITDDTDSLGRAFSLQKKYSTTYFLSTLLFPKRIRADIAVLYAFLRIPDEIVDNAASEDEARADIMEWQRQWQECVASEGATAGGADGSDANWVMRQMRDVHVRNGIPFALSDDFLSAMIQDTRVLRYADYESLRQYMYGSAAVVGRMVTYIVGVSDPEVLAEADKLGYAMQLTNFLRDIGDDYDTRGRIYLPLDEMAACGVTETMIAEKQLTPAWHAFMQCQIARNRALYREAERALVHLPRYARTAIKAASILYESQLDDIEQAQYNTFTSYKKKAIIRKISLLGREAIISLWRKK